MDLKNLLNGGWLPKQLLEENTNEDVFYNLFLLYIRATLSNQIFDYENKDKPKNKEYSKLKQEKARKRRNSYNVKIDKMKKKPQFKKILKEFQNKIKEGREKMRAKEYRQPYKAIFNNMVKLDNIPSIDEFFTNGEEDATMKSRYLSKEDRSNIARTNASNYWNSEKGLLKKQQASKKYQLSEKEQAIATKYPVTELFYQERLDRKAFNDYFKNMGLNKSDLEERMKILTKKEIRQWDSILTKGSKSLTTTTSTKKRKQ